MSGLRESCLTIVRGDVGVRGVHGRRIARVVLLAEVTILSVLICRERLTCSVVAVAVLLLICVILMTNNVILIYRKALLNRLLTRANVLWVSIGILLFC